MGFGFSLAPGGSSTRTVTAGGQATYNLVATAAGGYTGVVNFNCNVVGLFSASISCRDRVTPASFTFTASATSVNLTVVVLTIVRAQGAPLAAPRMPMGGLGILSGQAFLLLLMTLIALAGLRNRRAWVLLAATLLFVAMLAACGGNNNALPGPPGTPAGTYTLAVTATAADGTAASIPLTLIVN